MSDEQFKTQKDLLEQILKEIREGFAQLNKDRQYDFEHFDNQLKEIYLVVGQSRHEAHVLTDTAQTAIDKVEEHSEKTLEKINEVKKSIEAVPIPEEEKGLTRGTIFSKLLGRKEKPNATSNISKV